MATLAQICGSPLGHRAGLPVVAMWLSLSAQGGAACKPSAGVGQTTPPAGTSVEAPSSPHHASEPATAEPQRRSLEVQASSPEAAETKRLTGRKLGTTTSPGSSGPMMVQQKAPEPWQNYLQVAVLAPKVVQVSSQDQLRVKLTTLAPWKLNYDFPIRLELVDAGSNLEVKKRSQPAEGSALNGQSYFIEAELHAQRPGSSRLDGHVDLAVCTENACLPLHIPLNAEIEVLAPSPMPKEAVQR